MGGLYFGSVVFSTFATLSLVFKAETIYKMECSKNGYIKKENSNSLKENAEQYWGFIIAMIIPICNLCIACGMLLLSADAEKMMQETIKKELESGELVKVENISNNEKIVNEISFVPNKNYEDMTIAEKISFLEVEKQKLVNLSLSSVQTNQNETDISSKEEEPVYLKK